MISWLISLFSSAFAPILAGLGGLFAVLIGKWLYNRKSQQLKNEQAVNKAHEVIEKVHKEDVLTDQETDMRIDELRNKVSHESAEQGAAEVSGAINDYFGANKR